MRKHKNKIIAGVIIAIVLAFVFWYGGDAPGLRGWEPQPNEDVTIVQTDEPTKDEIAEAEKVVSDIPVKEENAPATEENKPQRKMKSAESSKLKQIFKAIDEMAEELTEIDNTLVRNIIEKMEVIAKDKLTIWFIGDIAYEIEIPELKVQEKY